MEKYLNKFYDIIDKIGKPNFILIVFILIIVIVTGLYQTFSLYTESLPPSLVDGVMTYQFILKASNDTNTITIPANSSKNVDITVTNESASPLTYGVYYSTNSEINIGYLQRTSSLPNDNIEAKSDNVVTIRVDNMNNSNITITFGVKYGFINGGDLTLETGQNFLELYKGFQWPLVTLIKKDAQLDTGIDFSKISSDTNGNGVYIRSGTENTANPIYYYRGNVENNVIFGGMCFKIVRTTETGGVKLIYNGLPTNGECIATRYDSSIGAKQFNANTTSAAYAGYMYGTVYERDSMSLNGTHIYGNNVTYSNGQYTLTTTQTGYSAGLNSRHYTCGSTSSTCASVKYIYYVDNTTAYYITLSGGKKVETALSEMLDYNTTSSTIKGNRDTAGTIDNWYYNKIQQAGYASYIEDTVWCGDRSIYRKGGWEPNGGSTSETLYFGPGGRLDLNKTPSLTCERAIDRFSVSSANGNGALDYPVGLLTADEIVFAGGVSGVPNSDIYLNDYSIWYTISPFRVGLSTVAVFHYNNQAALSLDHTYATREIRPAISLKPGAKISGGTGTIENPYIILTS